MFSTTSVQSTTKAIQTKFMINTNLGKTKSSLIKKMQRKQQNNNNKKNKKKINYQKKKTLFFVFFFFNCWKTKLPLVFCFVFPTENQLPAKRPLNRTPSFLKCHFFGWQKKNEVEKSRIYFASSPFSFTFSCFRILSWISFSSSSSSSSFSS